VQLPVHHKQDGNRTRHAKRRISAAADIRGTAAWAEGRQPSSCQAASDHLLRTAIVAKNHRPYHGALPRTPALPRRWRMRSRSSPRPDRHSPTPEPPGATRAHFDRPRGQTLAAPGEPAVAPRVPDRGDDLTSQPDGCPSRPQDHRAISVQLAGDHRGHRRLLADRLRRRSHSTTSLIGVIPKLTVHGCSLGCSSAPCKAVQGGLITDVGPG